ncbi:hypothetical protein RD792_014584 [Penstemon davidsonii]|uniref:GATA-type domain-containing protein n=1 Tax=Penstemon davidsonii TaxID=160366 RepID=A0ABR0CPP2_9LAMI|nr:hypothetical protein RD792_014584 [Penstemon davidsonii]
MNLNSLPSPFDQDHDDQAQLHHFAPNHRLASSSSSVACHFFFDSTQEYYHRDQLYPQHHQEVDNYGYRGGSSSTYGIKNKVEASGLKLTLWKKEVDHVPENKNNMNPAGVKWMSSKMRLMQKMKNNPNRVPNDDRKLHQASYNVETDLSSNNSSYNNNSNPIRVCSDCNTTKTPLWRSGPKGPKVINCFCSVKNKMSHMDQILKLSNPHMFLTDSYLLSDRLLNNISHLLQSLCNACGIRQRKARRAMAAATANDTSPPPPPPLAMKIKVQHKEKNNNNTIGENGHVKKRLKMADDAGSTSSNGQKVGFEDFLINLSEKLAFHRVFPEDEKDAAILLMALSSGLVHG